MRKSAIFSLAALIAGSSAIVSCNKAAEAISNVDLVPVKTSKEKWSMLDKDGKILFEDEFKDMPSLVYNGVFSVEKNDKYTVYKYDGGKYSELGELEGLYSVGYMEDGLIPASMPKERICVYDASGKKKFEVGPIGGKEVTSTAPGYSDGMLRFTTEESKVGYLDKAGKVAIKASYDDAADFSEGLALVKIDDEAKEKPAFSVIDKKGETVFKLKEGHMPISEAFSSGYIIVWDSDRPVLYDTKGEIKTFPSKVANITQTDGKYVIFRNEDNEMGVVDMEGEIIVRPKYDYLFFNGSDSSNGFIAWDEKESLFINTKGEQERKIDFARMRAYGDFGYFGEDGSRISQINGEGKPICKSDFYNINLDSRSGSYSVRSDFFDTNGVAKTVASLVAGNKVGDYTFGAKASSVATGSPSYSDTYTSSISLDKLSSSGYRYEISAEGYFNRTMATGEWGPDYSYEYVWNPESQLGAVRIFISAQTEWGKTGYDALVSAFKTAGFGTVKEGYVEGDTYVALMSKGNINVLITSEPKSSYGYVMVFDKKIEDVSILYDNILKEISTTKGGSRSYDGEDGSTPDYDDAAVEAVEEAWVTEAPAEEAW